MRATDASENDPESNDNFSLSEFARLVAILNHDEQVRKAFLESGDELSRKG